ncbi:beta-2-microglobulin-like [Erpetoichthys calabaricus]|uniref:Beta-2-microglobulin n=1 Tax=Erpetoichthys calabaricus TaxID=27687 RepID=A0A8C4SJN3_ERPCA|nr:beta-2-microglobulin-like [Erpetoichthys calabaricus]
MNFLVAFVVLGVVCCSVSAKESKPKVQIYTRNPGVYGQENVLICYVSDFHPPNVKVQLYKNDVKIPGTKTSDLAFKRTWDFFLMQTVPFTPQKGDIYSCAVDHSTLTGPSMYTWEPDM